MLISNCQENGPANPCRFETRSLIWKRICIILFTISSLISAATFALGQTTVVQGCRRANPTVTIGPSPQSAFSGNKLNYLVTITNNDSAACPGSNFTAMATFPEPGFRHFPDSVSLTLSPGETGFRTVIIIAPGKACVGSRSFRETVINDSAFGFSGFADAIFNVVPFVPDCGHAEPTVSITPCTDDPKTGECVSIQEATAGESLMYRVTVTNNDKPACGASAFIVTPSLSSGLFSHLPADFSISASPGDSGFRDVLVRSRIFTLKGIPISGDLPFTETATHGCATCLSGSANAIFRAHSILAVESCCRPSALFPGGMSCNNGGDCEVFECNINPCSGSGSCDVSKEDFERNCKKK